MAISGSIVAGSLCVLGLRNFPKASFVYLIRLKVLFDYQQTSACRLPRLPSAKTSRPAFAALPDFA
jgi:hypothetical protein